MNKKYVRLVNSIGEWRITHLESNKTEITYTWNGELLGDFPDWALSRAWKQQGLEVITWIQEAVNKNDNFNVIHLNLYKYLDFQSLIYLN